MKRSIFALGGGYLGEHRDAYAHAKPPQGREYFPWDTKLVDELIVATARIRNPQVLLISTPSEDGQHDVDLYFSAFKKCYESLNCSISILKLIQEKPSRRQIEAAITSADIVYVSGGNSLRAMKTWRRLGLGELLRKAYEKGTVMSGLSAGAICWFKYGNSNSFYRNTPFRVQAMGWIEALLCPHYDTEPFRQAPFKGMIKRTPKLVGLALDEYAAIEIVNEAEFRVHAYKPGAKARKCYWYLGKYKTEEIKQMNRYAPLKELLTAS